MSRFHLLIKSVSHYISDWSEEQKLFAWSALISSTFFIIPNNKILLFVSFVFVLGLYYILNNFTLSLLYAYIYLLPFQSGKGIHFLLIPGYYIYGHKPFMMTVNLTISTALSAILLYIYIRNRILLKKKRYAPHVDVSDVLLGIYITATIIASIISNIPWLSFLLTIQLSGYIFVYYFIRNQRLQRWVMKIIIPLLASLCILEGLWSGLQYINKGALGYLNPEPWDSLPFFASENASFPRLQGTFSHPNFLGVFMAFAVPMLLYYSISRHTSYFSKIICAIASLAGTVALILSGSRASWVFFTLGILVMLRVPIIRKSLHVISLVKRFYLFWVVCFAGIIPVFIIPRIHQLTVTFQQNGGAEFRWNLIEKSLMVASHNPFGVGMGVFPQILLQKIGGFTSPPTQPHNLIAQILVASGFIGVISFIGFFYLSIKTGFHKIAEEPEYSKIVRTVNAVSLGTYLCLSMFYPILTEQQIFAWVWILLSVVV